MSFLREDYSDSKADFSHFQMGVQHDQTRRKIEKFSNIRTLDKLVQRWTQEVKLQFHNGPTLTATKVSDSPLSEKILEHEFLKKFLTQTFEYNCGASNPVNTLDTFRIRW